MPNPETHLTSPSLFPSLVPEAPFRTPRGRAGSPSTPPPPAGTPLHLPNKPTCTAAEAAEATGISERQIRYWVEDGTLLAINAARCPIGPRAQRRSLNDRWRIVVRRSPDLESPDARAFRSLEELITESSNMEAAR